MNVSLTDFGFARKVPDGASECAVRGTQGYVPFLDPAIYSDMLYRPETDIYALGLTVFQLATGLVPYSTIPYTEWAEHRRQYHHAPEVLDPSWRSKVSPECLDFITVCLSERSVRPSARALYWHPWIQKHMREEQSDPVRFDKKGLAAEEMPAMERANSANAPTSQYNYVGL